MKSKLNILGLALVLALAMIAATASAAHAAAKFMTQKEAQKNINAELVGETVNVFHVFTVKDEKGKERKFTCKTAQSATAGEIAFPREEVTLLPTYGNCETPGISSIKVDLNGCDYTFSNFLAAGGTWHGDLSLVCPAGKSIEFTLEIEKTRVCTLTLLPKAKVAGLTISNVPTTGMPPTGGDLLVNTNVAGFEAIYDPEVLEGCVALGTGKGTATYSGESTIQAKNNGALVDLTME